MKSLGLRLCLAAAAALLGSEMLVARAAENKGEEKIASVAALPAAARATVEKLIAGGTVKSITKENEDGKIVFDVKATVKGKDVEYSVDADGKVLTSAESVEYSSMPAAVRTAAEKHFGSATGLEAAKEIEAGKTAYEVEGNKDGGKVTLKLDETGKVLEEEKHNEKD